MMARERGGITLVNRSGTAQLIPGHKAVGEKGQGGSAGGGEHSGLTGGCF